MPSKIQLVRIDLDIPGYRDLVTNIGDELSQRHTKKLGHRDEPGKCKKMFPPFQSVQEEDYSESPVKSLSGKVLLQHDVLH